MVLALRLFPGTFFRTFSLRSQRGRICGAIATRRANSYCIRLKFNLFILAQGLTSREAFRVTETVPGRLRA